MSGLAFVAEEVLTSGRCVAFAVCFTTEQFVYVLDDVFHGVTLYAGLCLWWNFVTTLTKHASDLGHVIQVNYLFHRQVFL